MVTVEARVMSLVCGNLKVFGEVSSVHKNDNNIADGLFWTVECNDKSVL